MRRGGFLAGVCAAALWIAGRAPAAAIPTARTVRVRLFKGRALLRLSVSGPDASGNPQLYSFDADTTFKPMQIGGGVPLTVNAYDANGLVASRRYGGSIVIAPDPDAGILVVNSIDLEDYVGSVLENEIGPSWPFESVKAQAIAVRTYALRAAARPGARAYDLGDDTSSQVYQGIDGIDSRLVAAAKATAGLALFAGASFAEVFYSAACGGHTASAIELTGAVVPPYLGGILDADSKGRAYCGQAPFFAWQNVIAAESMARIFEISADDLTGIDVTSSWPDGRVRTIAAHRRGAADVVLQGRALYTRASELLGYKVVPSLLFQIQPDAGGYRVAGHGLGHGVGMCQWGARGRADAGADAQAILAAYFPGTTLGQA